MIFQRIPPTSNALLIPANGRWEWWNLSGSSASSSAAPKASAPSPASSPSSISLETTFPTQEEIPDSPAPRAVALPSRYFLNCIFKCIPASREDLEVIVKLDLETRGLIPVTAIKTGGLLFHDLGKPTPQSEKTQVSVCCLIQEIPEKLLFSQTHLYFPSVFVWSYPQDGVYLLREDVYPIFILVRNQRPVYFQQINASTLDFSSMKEIQSILLGLQADHILPQNSQQNIPVFTSLDLQHLSPAELQHISQETGISLQLIPSPSPHLPSTSGTSGAVSLNPPEVDILRSKAKRQAFIQKSAKILIAGYALLFFLLLGLGLQSRHQLQSLQDQIREHQPEVQMLQTTARKWQALDPAINREIFPVERLYQMSLLLPEEGVRLIKFQQKLNGFFISGEAASAPLAFKLANDLKESNEWVPFQWEAPQPKLLSNNIAQFQLLGKRLTPDTSTQSP